MTRPGRKAQPLLQDVLGYVNFSSGAADPKFLAGLNELYRQVLAAGKRAAQQTARQAAKKSRPPADGTNVPPSAEGGTQHTDSHAGRPADRCGSPPAAQHPAQQNEPPVQVLYRWLSDTLDALRRQAAAFADAEQAQAVLKLVFEHFLPHYRQFHHDLLYHQQDIDLQQPFFMGRVFEAVLAQGPPWNETERIVTQALRQVNDYVGYRPVAVLESRQKMQPYDHEWVRPIPLYVAGAGVAVGRYEPLIRETMEILAQTDPELLARAWFDPQAVDELALDPRAYDFDHPVNNRPNYHFGQWDPHVIDNRGRYRRFVVQQVTLDALLSRVEQAGRIPRAQRLREAAAVLAGTILMASGTTGGGPNTHDSTTTLTTLVPRIAAYRDDFYEQLLERMQGTHAGRLRKEAEMLHQPFGGARQHLNQELSRRRATQVQQVHLAQVFARMGYPDAAMQQAQSVRVASARMLCQMYCRLTLGHRALDSHDPQHAAALLPEIEDLLHRAIECGALVDPWNIVGFGGNFSLFPAAENSIRDYRVDVLIELMDQIFALCARAWSEAAARDDSDLESVLSTTFARLAAWWDGFATASVSDIRRLVGKEQEISTNLVAGALNAWHKAGAAAGDVAFWRMFVDQFDSPKAFQLVVEALMERGDRVASMALLMQWLSQNGRIAMEEGDASIHRLLLRWLRSLEQGQTPTTQGETHDDPWPLVRRLFDYLEANADQYWRVPQLELGRNGNALSGAHDELPDEDEEDEPPDIAGLDVELLEDVLDEEDDDGFRELFSAAYEDMSYRDTTDDGVEGELLGPDESATRYELDSEAARLGDRLAFLTNLARMWKTAAGVWGAGPRIPAERCETFHGWHGQAAHNSQQLLRLLESVHRDRLPQPSGNYEALVEYDRRRIIKENLMEQIVATMVQTADAQRILQAAAGCGARVPEAGACTALLGAVLAGDSERVAHLWPDFIVELRQRPILYVPLSKGGDPAQIVQARATLQGLHDLLAWLPRLGLIQQTCDLLQTIQNMEADNPIGAGAVTEFDRLFETGHKAVIESIVASAESWGRSPDRDMPRADAAAVQLVDCLLHLTRLQLKKWLHHSRTLRLSIVEKAADERNWQKFVRFVKRYGHGLFTQKFLHLGNLRAILHQGVDVWLARLEADPAAADDLELLGDLGQALPRSAAIKHLSLALEAVVENYPEYRDYNSTTTQSDRGELFYILIDFLRLKADYDRIAWKLKPAVLAHQVLVQHGCNEAAELWRRKLLAETCEEADRHIEQFNARSQRYGMRLRTIGDRLSERFVRPLAIDRVRALVGPAMDDARSGQSSGAFRLLQQEIEELAREPTGVGFDLPSWLIVLQEEVSAIRSRQRQSQCADALDQQIPQKRLTLAEVQLQLERVAVD